MTDRPDLLDAPPTRGGRVTRAAEPVPVVVTVRWADLVEEQLAGVATHWAGDGADAVVHCRLNGSRFRMQVETWFPASDVRRVPTGMKSSPS